MKIYRPVKTNKLSQGFDENKACIRTLPGGEIAPEYSVKGTKDGTCPIGYKLFYPAIGMLGHNGLDHTTWHGEPLYFPVDIPGIKWWARTYEDGAGGLTIDVYSDKRVLFKELPKGAGELARREWQKHDGRLYVMFRFVHLKSFAVKDGNVDLLTRQITKNPISFGDLIGYCDSTGASSGDHLHWAMKIVADNSMTLDNNNGYLGAIDHTPWFENVFCLDVIQVKQEALSAIELARKTILQIKMLLGLR